MITVSNNLVLWFGNHKRYTVNEINVIKSTVSADIEDVGCFSFNNRRFGDYYCYLIRVKSH